MGVIKNNLARARHKSANIPSPAAIERSDEWVRIPRHPGTICGLGRSFLFLLCRKGLIRTVLLGGKNNKGGVRLVHVPSIRAMIDALADEQAERKEGV